MTVGRPSWVPTPETIEEVERMASRGLTQEQIADAIGIGLSTLMNKKNQFEEFKDAIVRGQAKGIGAVANALFNNAVDKSNVQAQMFYLKNRAKWRDDEPEKNAEELGKTIGSAVKEALSKNEQPR